MKNHEWVDRRLLQTNKKYSHLKQKQKERIYQWMYDAYRATYMKSKIIAAMDAAGYSFDELESTDNNLRFLGEGGTLM